MSGRAWSCRCRDVFQQNMSAADEADDDLANDLVLADDDLAAVIDNLLGVFLEFDGVHIVSSGKNFWEFQ